MEHKAPFVVCHMLTSLDGKIDGDFFRAPEAGPAQQAYGSLRGFYRCQATLYGTTTMLGGYADGAVSSLPEEAPESSRQDFINPEGLAVGNFIVSMDPQGELAFHSHLVARKGRPTSHVIQALTQKASPRYLSYLRKRGISYLFAGEDRLDCSLLLRKLSGSFGISRLMVAGGGITNQAFLQDGLIDELSLVIAPVADGGNALSVFEPASFLPDHVPVPFTVEETKVLPGNTLWLRYHAGKP